MLRSSRTGPTKTGKLTRASTVIVGALVALFGVIAGPLLGVLVASPASAAAAASGYTAITPYRALGTTAAGASVTAGTPVNVQITGTTVPAGATAAVLNVTASASTAAGYLTLYPEGGTAPSTSNVNFTAGETVANLVTVPLSSTGGVTVANYTGTTAVDVDVEGYYSAAGAGLYNPVSPVRVEGTLAAGASIGANATVPVTVTGGTIPTTATAVVVNLTAAGGTAASYLSAYAAGATPAVTSSLNFTAGETVANRDIVDVGTGGQIEVYNYAGSVNVDVDVDGYYGPTGSQFVALAAPIRLTDTRSPTDLNGTSIASGGTETFDLTTTASTIPTTATAVAANFTVVPGEAPGYITVFPTGVTTTPTASDVNWPASSGPVANFTQADTAGTTTGSVQVYNLDSGSPVDLVIDAFGYFTAGTAASTSVNVAVPSTTGNTISVPALPADVRTVTATVTNGVGGAVIGDDYTVATVVTAGGGTITGGVDTSADGVATFTYTPPTYSATGPTAVTISVKEYDLGQTGVATIDLTEPPNAVTLSAASPTVPANGTTTDLLTAGVTAAAAGTADNDAVTFATSGGSAGTIGTPSGTTGAAGTTPVTATYTSSTTPGFYTVTATEGNTGGTDSIAIDQTSSPALATPTVVATPTTATVAYGGTTTISFLVSNAGGPIAGDQVEFAATGTGADTVGTLAPASGVTAANGTISVTYTAPTTGTISPTVSISATEADAAVTSATPAVVTEATSVPPVVTFTTTDANDNVPVSTAAPLDVSISNVTAADNDGAVVFTADGADTGCGAVPAATTLAVTTDATTGTAASSYTASASAGTACEYLVTVSTPGVDPVVLGTATLTLDQID